MRNRSIKSVRLLLASLAAFLLALAGSFFWNEARKEVVFLCGNFTAGVSEESVTRQLDTGHYLRQRREARPEGVLVVVDSAWSFGAHRCLIELGNDGLVERAWVE